MIGATTLDEYRKHVEKDPALERRFQQVYVGEPTVEDTIAILRGPEGALRGAPRRPHPGLALVSAAVLSNRYLTNRFLPDKAIDLVDEAAKLRIEIDSLPTEIDVVERRILQLEIERVALAKETDPASQERLPGPRRGAVQAAGPVGRDEGALGGRARGHRRHPHAQGGAGGPAHPARAGDGPGEGGRDPLGAHPELERRIADATRTSTSCRPAGAC